MDGLLHKIESIGVSSRFFSVAVFLTQALLLALIGWFLVRAILLWLNPESAWTSFPKAMIQSGPQAEQIQQSFDFSSDPFRLGGSASVNEPSVVFNAGFDVPETTLNLILKGRTVGNPGSAVLKTPDNKEASYRVGDKVMQDVTLHSVSPQFVVLDVRGDLQRLTFAKPDSTGLAVKVDAQASDVVSVKTAAGKQSGNTMDTAPVNQAFSTEALMKSARFNPQFETGQLVGYVVRARGDEAVLTQFGLRSGDAITAINGESLLKEPINPQAMISKLRKSRGVRLDILRDGRPQTITIGQ